MARGTRETRSTRTSSPSRTAASSGTCCSTAGRRRPARAAATSIDLANALTEPGARGSGAGVALTEHALGWAHEHGYTTMITDWRMTNLLASRFWPRRGFRETFLRLYRSIP